MISVIRSGIDAALNDLGVTSNNIANAKTTGFKKRQATFSDVYGNTDSIKMTGARIGMGAITSENRVMSKQGTLQQTGDVLDLAIEGRGLFTVVDEARPDERLYTRDGSFTVSADGLVANADGLQLMSAFGTPIIYYLIVFCKLIIPYLKHNLLRHQMFSQYNQLSRQLIFYIRFQYMR